DAEDQDEAGDVEPRGEGEALAAGDIDDAEGDDSVEPQRASVPFEVALDVESESVLVVAAPASVGSLPTLPELENPPSDRVAAVVPGETRAPRRARGRGAE